MYHSEARTKEQDFTTPEDNSSFHDDGAVYVRQEELETPTTADAEMVQVVIRPFAEHDNFTQFHNAVLDEVMPKCPASAWKVLSFVIRKTKGWHKGADELSYSQIREGTGIRSDSTVRAALDWLISNDLLSANKRNGRTTTYMLNREYEITTLRKSSVGLQEREENLYKNRRGASTETVDTEKKEINKKEKEERPAAAAKEKYPHYDKEQHHANRLDDSWRDDSIDNDNLSHERDVIVDHVDYLASQIEESGIPFMETDRVRYLWEFGDAVNGGASPADLRDVADRIAQRFHAHKLSYSLALQDVRRMQATPKEGRVGQNSNDIPATAKQIGYIESLLTEIYGDGDDPDTIDWYEVENEHGYADLEDLTRKQASTLIKTLKKAAEAAEEDSPFDPTSVRI